MLDYSKSFIETQFPVSKVSKESYKERKAVQGQTLTGLGKWWGRKPLILVRATILGLLLPISENPNKDRDIFLKLLTMDNEGLLMRKSKNIPTKQVFQLLTNNEKEKYFSTNSTVDKPTYRKEIKKTEKDHLQQLVFNRLSYDDKLKYSDRPEHIKNLPESAWQEINDHLETTASNLQELTRQLGEKRYGHVPRIGDCFAGGGSIPFEAGRMGADIYASDLNPVASLLTWASLNIAGANHEEIAKLQEFQHKVYEETNNIILSWGIEENEQGWRGNAYLYCNETTCPECRYKIPLLPTLIIGRGPTNTIARLEKDSINKNYKIKIIENVSNEELKQAEKNVTINDYSLKCPNCMNSTPIPSIRKDKDDGILRDYRYNTPNELRKWDNTDFKNQDTDIFTERLYCIRYEEVITDSNGNEKIIRHFVEPNEKDIENEHKVEALLRERFNQWREKGYLPNSLIEKGWNTNQLTYEKGWTNWSNLYNPRQLLLTGLLFEVADRFAENRKEKVIALLGINKCANWNSKLSRWDKGKSPSVKDIFYNQSFNTLFNYGCRGLTLYKSIWFFNINSYPINSKSIIKPLNASEVEYESDIWITDPPYADAVHYHELAELFLAWDKNMIRNIFPEWYSDSKRVLAVKGTGESFNKSMIYIYKNLSKKMPDNGTQVVMFTHQDTKVWAELAMILWSSGLRVVSAWNIATETESGGLKDGGNYVKGTVLLILKKQTSEDIAFQDELYRKIKKEVQFQIDSMRNLDDKEDPNFTDADYLLAAYASSLKVLTAYKDIEGIDVQYELSKSRNSDEENPIEALINKAVKIAYDYLIPEGVDSLVWRDLLPEERFFIRGLELEMGNIYQVSAYQELARGFGVKDYKDMFENFKANSVRLKTATEYRTRGVDNDVFGSSLMRHVLVSLYQCVQAESTVEGINYLKAKYDQDNEYWDKRSAIMEILGFISRFENISHMKHWQNDAYYARLLQGAVRNDGI
ncbi:anti-phage-associated DUF1156 domain-containing protein [Oceanobacillus indicireducens]|uniref:DNA methylase n=1 Tax=Oceanobacillus indicireducens TaxID=1004261 RepID=A0A917XYS6_9BACI|nr:anti-phage-associated DUF1156 domain-containing protein [Oceanobacillus indicireducens]GGN57550.1 DNA methylase [Oceanobacillus indicireducens]